MIIKSRSGKVIREVPGDSLEGADLSGADLSGADLEGADLTDAVLDNAILRGAILRGVNLRGADIENAKLTNAKLTNAKLTDANLRGAILRSADLRSTDLRSTDLRSTDLRGVNLRGADLEGADLRGADIEGAILRGAILRSADLRDVSITADDAPGLRELLGIEHDPTLPARVLEQIVGHPESHDQENWHSCCGTKHCVAGWFVTLAGSEGRRLEAMLGTSTAATLLAGMPGVEMPSFEGAASREDILGALSHMVAAATASYGR